MLHTTFRLAHKAGACIGSYRKMAEALGGIPGYGRNTPIPLDKVLEVCGLHDAIWTLRCTIEPSENFAIEFACRCAEHVLHFYEDKCPEDKRPRQAIEATRNCITDKSPAARAAVWAARAAVWAARDAVWAARDAAGAAGAAAWDAAWAVGAAAEAAARAAVWAARDAVWAVGAAEAAAWDAEEEWQSKTFLEMLENS